jgi:hypothetical protein
VTEGPLPDDPLPPQPVGASESEPDRCEAAPSAPAERRYPSTIGGAFYIAILLTTAIGLGIVVSGNWRVGVRWVALSLVAGSALRLVLPQRDAGMLAVRHRALDCVLLAAVGAALLFLAETIPEQPL